METRIINGLTVKIENKQSNFGSGKKTVYSGNFVRNGEQIEFENKAIDALNALCGIPRISNGKRTICINNPQEIENKANSLIERVQAFLKKSDSLLRDFDCDISFEMNAETVAELKDAIVKNYTTKCIEFEKAKKEREEKQAVSEISLKIKEALKRGDFAEVARLSSLQVEKSISE